MKELWANNGNPVDLLIWVVVAVLWGVAQLLQGRRRRPPTPGSSASPPAPPPSSEADLPGRLRDFLESLAGEPQRSPPPLPGLGRPAWDTARRGPSMPRHATPQHPVKVRLTPAPVPASPGAIALPLAGFKKTADVASVFRSPGQGSIMRGLLMDLSGIRTPPMPRLALVRMNAPSGAMEWLHDRKQLRRAMLSRLVLGPPPALPPVDPFGGPVS